MSDRRLFIAGSTGATGVTVVKRAHALGVVAVAHVRPGSEHLFAQVEAAHRRWGRP